MTHTDTQQASPDLVPVLERSLDLNELVARELAGKVGATRLHQAQIAAARLVRAGYTTHAAVRHATQDVARPFPNTAEPLTDAQVAKIAAALGENVSDYARTAFQMILDNDFIAAGEILKPTIREALA